MTINDVNRLRFLPTVFGSLFCLLLASSSYATVIRIGLQTGRSPSAIGADPDQVVRQFGAAAARLTDQERAARIKPNSGYIFSLPVTVVASPDGLPINLAPKGRGRGPDLNLQFSVSRPFPQDYRDFLAAVYTKVKPALTASFGAPYLGGDITVSNYDADIGDRDAVAGGYYYYDSGSGTQEIRFPEFADGYGIKYEVAAVNFVHTLLLAYLGPDTLGSDPWREGLVRAVTMQIVRTPGNLPNGLDQDLVEMVLESSYDISPTYDWNNQRALSGPTFIAANLRSQPLPIGGSVGGLYLLRYMMAGTAWEKVLLEYPAFASDFLGRYHQNPASYQTDAQLIALAQASIDFLAGGAGTIEGMSFSQWAERQHILCSTMTVGPKLLIQPFPVTYDLAGNDFGVFAIQAHAFTTAADGSESLSRHTSYPIYWSPDFTRIFASAQDDKMEIFAGYGSVTPNFTGSAFGGTPYRVTVDVPVGDQMGRVHLPAGAVAKASSATVNNFYGSVTGITESLNISYSVRISYGATIVTMPVTNYVFGKNLVSNFTSARSGVVVELIRTTGGTPTVILTRRINKGPGALAVDLHYDAEDQFTLTLPKGVSMAGFVGDPFRSYLPDLLGISSNQLQVAHWNSTTSRYDFFPSYGAASLGQGFLIRTPVAKSALYTGRLERKTPVAIALNPGWNIVNCPLDEEAMLSDVQVVSGTGFPNPYQDAASAETVGAEVFTFAPSPNDPHSKMPETGTMIAADRFSPGKGVFVRVFAAEGASLLFTPSEMFGYGGKAKSRAPSSNSIWQVAVQLSAGKHKAQAIIGQSMDARLEQEANDCELPPSFGGMQVVVKDVGRLYRDMRRLGQTETYTIYLEGLKPKTAYKLDLAPVAGKAPAMTLIDSQSKLRKIVKKKFRYGFKATGTSRTITISVPRSL